MDDDRELEDRLASYRPLVEKAMARRPFHPYHRGRRSRWVVSVIAAGTVTAGVIGWVALSPTDEPASTGAGSSVASTAAPAAPPVATLTLEQEAMLAQYLELINATTVPLTSGGDIGSPIVFAIGDSIMLGAASSLQALGITVDAQESLQLADVVDLQVVAGRADAFVIHVGTNGTIDAGDLDAVMDSLVEVPRVVVLTVAIDRPWVEGNNDLLRALPARYPNVTVLDWAELAPACHDWAIPHGLAGNCFASDGFHLSEDGADYYASLIANVLGL